MLTQTSASELETFDVNQYGGCERRSWFEREMGLRPDQTKGSKEGVAGHALLERYERTGDLPPKKALMGKAVTALILGGRIPKPGADLHVEQRFDRRPKFDPFLCECGAALGDHEPGEKCGPKWLKVDPERTIKIAGVPFDGFIDLSYRRGDVPHVLDWKFKADLNDGRCKTGAALIRTVQMPTYGFSELRRWPDAREIRLTHFYAAKKAGVKPNIATAVFPVTQIIDRVGEIAEIVERKKLVNAATLQEDVPFNRKSCDAWMGCPHQSICSAHRRDMFLDEDESKMFGATTPPAASAGETAEEMFGDEAPAAPPPAPPPAAPAKPKLFSVPNDPVYEKECAEATALGMNVNQLRAARGLPPYEQAGAPAAPAPIAPPVQPAAPAISGFCTKCGAALTGENASLLQDKTTIKHVGCPKDAPAAPPAPPPAAEKPKAKPGPKPKAAAPAPPAPPAPIAPVIPNADPKAPAPPAEPKLSADAQKLKDDLELWTAAGQMIAGNSYPGTLCKLVLRVLQKIEAQQVAAKVAFDTQVKFDAGK